jgi:hypothetical protein
MTSGGRPVQLTAQFALATREALGAWQAVIQSRGGSTEIGAVGGSDLRFNDEVAA